MILFPRSVYIGFRLFVLLGRRSGDVSSMPWRVRGTLVSPADRSVGIQSCPNPPRRSALHRISLVRASGRTFRRFVFDALGGTRASCLLGEQFCWHPVLPDPAPPPRCAPRPDPPVVCPGFGFDKLASWKRIFDLRDDRPSFRKLPKIITLYKSAGIQNILNH